MMSESVEDTLTFLANVGYKEVEPAGLYGYSPERFGQLLTDLKLRAPSSHVGIPDGKDAQQRVFEDARAIGQKWVTDPYFGGGSIDAYKRFAEKLNEAGARARHHGLRVAYHNHAGEFTEMDGKIPYFVLLDETDPQLVDFELDTYWAVAGGMKPVDIFRRSPGRFPLTHIKDMGADGSMVTVGDGIIDFGNIFAHKSLAGFHHHFVEHDNPSEPEEFARESYQFLRNLTF